MGTHYSLEHQHGDQSCGRDLRGMEGSYLRTVEGEVMQGERKMK